MSFKLRNGKVAVVVETSGGVYNAAQLKTIAGLCEKEGLIAKCTEDHRITLFIDSAATSDIERELKAIGLSIRSYQSGLHQPVACLGEMCPEQEQDALGTAMDLTDALKDISLNSPFKIGVNGCARCCVPCHTLDIAVVGTAEGYRIHLGGKSSQIPELATFAAEGVPKEKVVSKVKDVVVTYSKQAEKDERLHQVIERVGMGEFVHVLAPYSQDAGNVEFPDTVPIAVLDESGLHNQDSVVEISTLGASDEHFDLATVELDEIGSLTEETMQKTSSGVDGFDENLELEELTESVGEEHSDKPIEANQNTQPSAANSDEEGLFEAEIERSIEEQSHIPALEDGLADDRLEAVEAIELGNIDTDVDSLSDSSSLDFSEVKLSDFEIEDVAQEGIDNKENSHDKAFDDGIEEIDETEIEDFNDIHALDDNIQDLPLSEIVGNNVETNDHQVISIHGKARHAQHAQRNDVNLTGFSFMTGGSVVLNFSNGSHLSLSHESFDSQEERRLDLAGLSVTIKREHDGIRILVNGMELFVPRLAG